MSQELPAWVWAPVVGVNGAFQEPLPCHRGRCF